MTLTTAPRWQAVYRIAAASPEEARARAFNIAVEQTIEYPYELVEGTPFAEEICGQITDLIPAENGCWEAVISYPTEAAGGELVQFINMLYGNSSLQPGVRLTGVSLPDALLRRYTGARYGYHGLRRRWHVPTGPVLMGVIKPLGHNTEELAAMVYAMARSGIHTVKDDHNLHNQVWAAYEDRITRCVEAARQANAQTGGHTAYLANVMADGTELVERAYYAQEAGADGIMLSPSIAGWGIVRDLARREDFTLPILLHPALSGPFIRREDTGIAAPIYNGLLPRLAGADGVIFTGGVGRFSFSAATCRATQAACLSEDFALPAVMPCAGGGVTRAALPALRDLYGANITLLIGGDLFRSGPDLTANVHALQDEIDRVYGN